MASAADTVSLDQIERARDVVADVARDTQVIESRYLSRTTGGTIALKAENLQRTGSFKLRGALNKIASLDPGVKGVITASAGNHGQSLAYAARARGLTATIFMPERAALAKIAAARESGAEIVLDGGLASRLRRRRPRATPRPRGSPSSIPFDDLAVVAGQGTIGLELLEEVPDLSRVLVPVGGGGLAAGIAAAIKESRDRRRGDRGPVALPPRRRDRGQAARRDHEPAARAAPRRVVTVDEDAIADAIMLLLERTKLVVEGAGAVGVAALRQGLIEPAESGTTVVILSGGNIDTGVLADIARHHETERGRRLRIFTTISDEPGLARRAAHPPRGGRGQPDRRGPRPRGRRPRGRRDRRRAGAWRRAGPSTPSAYSR